MVFDDDQRPPWTSVNLGRQVASKLGTHGPGVAVGAGHLKWEKFSRLVRKWN